MFLFGQRVRAQQSRSAQLRSVIVRLKGDCGRLKFIADSSTGGKIFLPSSPEVSFSRSESEERVSSSSIECSMREKE